MRHEWHWHHIQLLLAVLDARICHAQQVVPQKATGTQQLASVGPFDGLPLFEPTNAQKDEAITQADPALQEPQWTYRGHKTHGTKHCMELWQ